MGISWNYGLGAKGGQSVKVKKGEEITTDKSTEFGLSIKLKSEDEDLLSTITEICEKAAAPNEATLKFSGTQEQLKETVKLASKIIAKQGGQQTLDIHIDDEAKASH